MTNSVKQTSLGKKLFIATMLIILFSVTLVVLPVIYLNISDAKQSLLEQSLVDLDLITANSTAGLLFDHPQAIEELLKTLNKAPKVSSAHIYKLSEFTDEIAHYASYRHPDSSYRAPEAIYLLSNEEIKFTTDYLQIYTPIHLDNEVIGYALMAVSTNHLNKSILRAISITAIIVLSTLVVVAIILKAQQSRLLQPVLDLTNTAEKIINNHDYSLRVKIQSHDEIGTLTQRFNNMLDAIENYDQIRNKNEQVIKNLNENLEIKVTERTQQLNISNQELQTTLRELHDTQGYLVENEKMASLGSLVAGVAHEINTPLGISLTAASHLLNESHELQENHKKGNLTKIMFEQYQQDCTESTQIIVNNLHRAANLVKSFKQVSVDQSSEEVRSFNVKQYLQDILLSLQPELKQRKPEITLEIDDHLIISSFPGALSQIITNLIMNSVIHAFHNNPGGIINIKILKEDHLLSLIYTDNGAGIDPMILPRIFDPFITTKRGAGGSGLGTHIIYNLVSQLLGGNINVVSKLNQGATFTINFPVDTPDTLATDIPRISV